ncbi:MAG: hypothetical protein H5T72_10000 [Actinobacteria bacterium]|nr:hypothetical protein [Actinomycetota bacterium]
MGMTDEVHGSPAILEVFVAVEEKGLKTTKKRAGRRGPELSEVKSRAAGPRDESTANALGVWGEKASERLGRWWHEDVRHPHPRRPGH